VLLINFGGTAWIIDIDNETTVKALALLDPTIFDSVARLRVRAPGFMAKHAVNHECFALVTADSFRGHFVLP
jgi:hypothetical protein